MMEGKRKGTEEASKKRRRILSGLSILPLITSDRERPPREPREAGTFGGVTVSKVGPIHPTTIPLDRSVAKKALENVISLGSEETVNEGPPDILCLGTLLDTKKKYEKVKEVNTKLYEKIKCDRGSVKALKNKCNEAFSLYRRETSKIMLLIGSSSRMNAVEDLKARVKPVSDPVEDLSLKFSEAYISNEEPMDVSEDDERFSEDQGRGKGSAVG
ncbi:hypothetical protein LWI28_021551 [Acer negundo]|uniref:Uncharacterized protein n=1 Tax=Acer negundo TaxID=4023 RepID=A0AAD5JR05_ACENE|nr:hypothetical protein LWI28_021551 [Acer negundo]